MQILPFFDRSIPYIITKNFSPYIARDFSEGVIAAFRNPNSNIVPKHVDKAVEAVRHIMAKTIRRRYIVLTPRYS